MIRKFFYLTGIAITLTGCVTPPVPIVPRDSVDLLIQASAADAVKALRNLSETTGNSRVVTAVKKGENTNAPVKKIDPPKVTSSANTVAGRFGAVAIDSVSKGPTESVSANVDSSRSTGGLLSIPPAGLEKPITVHWTGELEELIQKVAQEAGWKFAEPTGFRVAPVIISINAENRLAFEVLRDIGAMAGTSADINVSAVDRTITVRYPIR